MAVCLRLLEAGIPVCPCMFGTGLKCVSLQRSVFGCLEQGEQSALCLRMLGARMGICDVSSNAWNRNDNLWSVFGCLVQGWQFVMRLRLLGAEMAVCGLCSAASSKDDNQWSIFGCLGQGSSWSKTSVFLFCAL